MLYKLSSIFTTCILFLFGTNLNATPFKNISHTPSVILQLTPDNELAIFYQADLHPYLNIHPEKKRIITKCKAEELFIEATTQSYIKCNLDPFDAKKIIDRTYPVTGIYSDFSGGFINISSIKELFKGKLEYLYIEIPKANNFVFHGKVFEESAEIRATDILKYADHMIITPKDNKHKIQFDTQIPIFLQTNIRDTYTTLNKEYLQTTGRKDIPAEMIIVNIFPSGDKGNWWGDLDKFGNISLRFYGNKWLSKDKFNRQGISTFIAHELFHRYFRMDEFFVEKQEDWVHEGGAEAFSLSLLRRLGKLNDIQLSKIILAKINNCRTVLSRNYYADIQGGRKGKFPYDCGFFAHFDYAKGENAHNPLWININLSSSIRIWKSITPEKHANFLSTRTNRPYKEKISEILAYRANPDKFMQFIKEISPGYTLKVTERDRIAFAKASEFAAFPNGMPDHFKTIVPSK